MAWLSNGYAVGFQWLSLVSNPVVDPWFLVVIVGYFSFQWLSLVTLGFQWLSPGFQWLSGYFGYLGFQWLSLVSSGYRWFSC